MRKKNVIVFACAVILLVGFFSLREVLLFRAASKGSMTGLRILVGAGVNVNARDPEGETPLMYASVEDRTQAVLLLLRKGAEINAVSTNNETALGRAAAMGRTETVKILVEKGANMEKGGDHGTTPLMYASSGGHLQTVRSLLQMGSRVNSEDQDGDTALSYASIRGAPKNILVELIGAGGDVEHRNKQGKTVAMLAAENGHRELTEFLKETGKKQ